jgi:hypothetical protein
MHLLAKLLLGAAQVHLLHRHKFISEIFFRAHSSWQKKAGSEAQLGPTARCPTYGRSETYGGKAPALYRRPGPMSARGKRRVDQQPISSA